MYKFLTLAVAALTLTGCYQTKTLNPNQMTYDEVQNVRAIKRGVVISVEQAQVHIDGSDDYAATGGLIGGLLGTQFGKGTGQTVAIGVGTIAGGIAGKMGTAQTVESFVYTVELQEGGLIQVSQQGAYIPQASKVLIKYYPQGRKTISVDQSQGVTFSTAKKTSYAEKEAAEQKAAAEKAAAEKLARQKAAAAQKVYAQKEAVRTKREQEAYNLELESKKLDLESKKLDVERKTKRVEHEDEFIEKELKSEGITHDVRGALMDIFK